MAAETVTMYASTPSQTFPATFDVAPITTAPVPSVEFFSDVARTVSVSGPTDLTLVTAYVWTVPVPNLAAQTLYVKYSYKAEVGGVLLTDSTDTLVLQVAGVGSGSADYTTAARLKASLGITDTNDDTALAAAITAASRAIDQTTGTTFYPVTETRTFEPTSSGDVWVDRFVSTSSLVVKTGTDGTYPTTVTSTDVLPWPYNATSHGQAYCRLRIPTGVLPAGYVRPTVQVTTAWGWDSVPDAVEEACLIKAARLFRRKDSPEGIAGTSEFGVVRISKFEDPDVILLLAPYMSIGLA